jgi:hypothetical protein
MGKTRDTGYLQNIIKYDNNDNLDFAGSGKFSGDITVDNIPNATTDTDKFLVSDSGVVKYRTGSQILSDLGVSGIYVPYTGATGNVNLGTHTLSSYNLIVNHTSGSGVAASITKGGSGEALTINKTSGSGNAMSVTGGLTSLVDLRLSSIPNATIDTDRFIVSDSGTIKYRTGAEVLSDIGGQAALTNPVTGTGTLNFVSKFTSTGSTLGNSQIYDNGTNLGVGTTSPSYKLDVSGTGRFTDDLNIVAVTPRLKLTDGTSTFLLSTNTSGEGIIKTEGTSKNIRFFNNSGETVRINGGGNVSIGNTNNTYKLDVSGTGRFTSDLTVQGTGNSSFSGNVGIGTTSPSQKLDVNGDVNSDFYRSNSDISTSTVAFNATNTTGGNLNYTVTNNRLICTGSFTSASA